jgi:hypothetical protein
VKLTADERQALESLGPQAVAAKLAASPGLGRGAEVRGFTCGSIDRGKCEDWLGEKNREQAARDAEQRTLDARSLWWGRFGVLVAIAAGIVACPLTVLAMLLAK